jgi:DNA helicase II / ATP-dependent DNA helicase PcrA
VIGSTLPEVTDGDIEWVKQVLSLNSVDEPRRCFLLSRSTLDVSACPGSGKTTLTVAKLAVLARKWPFRTRGICVMSHTNVAREEIQNRLGDTVAGQSLLRYPHFIGTIHGFVNQFLALPWLHSKGCPVVVIDDAATTAHRQRTLEDDYYSLKTALEKRHLRFDQLRICKRDRTFDFQGTAFPFASHTRSYALAARAIEVTAQAGYYCHSEMLVWASALLEDHPEISSWLSYRFPLIVMDEMQDTSSNQAALLERVFPRHSENIVVQRVGDPNQAIFDLDNENSSPNDIAGGESDHRSLETLGTSASFPDPERRLDISNSYRFGQTIARLASPFAVEKVQPDGLSGLGLSATTLKDSMIHAIFIFPDDSTEGVLKSFGQHVLEILPESLVEKGSITAVGSVHRANKAVNPGDKSYPRHVGHYWSNYNAEVTTKDPVPATLVGYVRLAQALITSKQDLAPAVDKVASGLIRYAHTIGDANRIIRALRPHRSILEALKDDPQTANVYRELLHTFLLDRVGMTGVGWAEQRQRIEQIGKATCLGQPNLTLGHAFLAWPGESGQKPTPGTPAANPSSNTFRVQSGDQSVNIHLGSIHSIKGQTHIATLILDTYNRTHFFHKLLPWLLGKQAHGNGNTADEKRLRQAFVGMTRPTHLLCLAIRRSSIGSEGSYERHITVLQQQGWQIAELREGTPIWRK